MGGYDECRFKTSFSYWADVPGNNGRYHFCLWRPLFVYLTTWQVISSRAVLSPSFSIDGPTHRNWSDTHINNFSLRGTTQCHSTFSEIVDHRQWIPFKSSVKKWDKNGNCYIGPTLHTSFQPKFKKLMMKCYNTIIYVGFSQFQQSTLESPQSAFYKPLSTNDARL